MEYYAYFLLAGVVIGLFAAVYFTFDMEIEK